MSKLGEGQRYVGTKFLRAWPMPRGEYNTYRGWTMPEEEDPKDKGYLVEYEKGGLPNHPDHTGYISWSPEEVFEATYEEVGEGDIPRVGFKKVDGEFLPVYPITDRDSVPPGKVILKSPTKEYTYVLSA